MEKNQQSGRKPRAPWGERGSEKPSWKVSGKDFYNRNVRRAVVIACIPPHHLNFLGDPQLPHRRFH